MSIIHTLEVFNSITKKKIYIWFEVIHFEVKGLNPYGEVSSKFHTDVGDKCKGKTNGRCQEYEWIQPLGQHLRGRNRC